MKNHKADGETLVLTAPTGGYTAGECAVLDSDDDYVGAPLQDTDAGDEAVLQVSGVKEFPLADGESIDAPKVVYVDSSGEITSASTGNTRAGRCWADAATSDTKILVKINEP